MPREGKGVNRKWISLPWPDTCKHCKYLQKKKNLKTIIETGQGLLVNNTVKVNLTSSVGDTAQQQHFTSYHIP